MNNQPAHAGRGSIVPRLPSLLLLLLALGFYSLLATSSRPLDRIPGGGLLLVAGMVNLLADGQDAASVTEESRHA